MIFTSSVTHVFRLVTKSSSLKTWNNFDWTDFVMLNKMSKTFKVRHLPLSNYQSWSDFEKFVYVPTSWKDQRNPTKKKKKRTPVPVVITVYNSSSEEEENDHKEDHLVEKGVTTIKSDHETDEEECRDSVTDPGSPSKESDDEMEEEEEKEKEVTVTDIVGESGEDSSDKKSDEVPRKRKKSQSRTQQKRTKMTTRKTSM